MNWDAIGAIGEIVGATAVLATLGYLSLQIRQQNRTTRFHTTKDLMGQYDEVNRLFATDANFRRVLTTNEDLSDEDSELLFSIAIMYCNIWATVQASFDQGQIDESIYTTLTREPITQLERFPNLRDPVRRWLNMFPEMGQQAMYLPVWRELMENSDDA